MSDTPVTPDHSLLPWLEDNGVLLSLIVGLILGPVIALILSSWAMRYQTSSKREEVANPASWPDLITLYSQTRMQGYYTGLQRFLGVATRLYGPKFLGGRALARSWKIAFIYPPAALTVGWVLFSVGQLNGVVFLPDGLNNLERFWLNAVLIFVSAISFCIVKIGRKFSRLLDETFRSRVQSYGSRISIRSMIARVPGLFVSGWIFVGAVVLTVALPIALIDTLESALSVARNGTFTVGFAFVGATACAAALTFALTVAHAGTPALIFTFTLILVVAQTSSGPNSNFYFTIFCMLSIFNGVTGFFSLAATRSLLTIACQNRPKAGRLGLDLLIDAGTAVSCLIGLIAVLVGVLTLWGALAPDSLHFDWRVYWADIRGGDRGKATILVMMAMTTLLPTVFHMIAGIAGFWASESPSWHRAVAAMRTPPMLDAQGTPPVIWVNTVTRYIRRGVFWGYFKAIVFVGALSGIGLLCFWSWLI